MSREQLIEHYKLEVEEDENYLGMAVYDFGESLYEFGKYTDFEPPKKSLKTFFKNKELNKYFTEEHDFNIVTKDFLEYIIESYKKRISDYYNDMMNPFFGVENGNSITSSWKYEYAIFELVRIYKSFDWKRNVMIYYGY